MKTPGFLRKAGAVMAASLPVAFTLACNNVSRTFPSQPRFQLLGNCVVSDTQPDLDNWPRTVFTPPGTDLGTLRNSLYIDFESYAAVFRTELPSFKLNVVSPEGVYLLHKTRPETLREAWKEIEKSADQGNDTSRCRDPKDIRFIPNGKELSV